MKTQIEFESSRFPPYEVEEEEINPGFRGKGLAAYLEQKLADTGVATEEIIAEDWATMFQFAMKGLGWPGLALWVPEWRR